jgi:5-methyltetrahydrofolate--homocysteine methyltransferase
VKGIHRAYLQAGAEVLLTNTFQANPEHLAVYPSQKKLMRVFETAVQLAREEAGERVVLADIGPMTTEALNDSAVIFQGCLQADGLLFETWSDPPGFGRIRELNYDRWGYCYPLLVSFAFRRNSDGAICTWQDYRPQRCAEIVVRSGGAAALGVNCGNEIALHELLEIVAEYRAVTDLPLFVRPNAGTPKQIGGQWGYPETPESMAAWLPALFEAGVVMVGGCCGTTPAHIAAFRKVVDEWNAAHAP